MDLNKTPANIAKSKIAKLYKDFPHAELRFSEFDKFAQAHRREPHLGSSYNDNPQQKNGLFDVLGLHYNGAQVASLSFFIEKNKMKRQEPNHFARIDIVIVEKEFRRLGLGKILVFTAIKYLLDRWGARIYSISCLAAHDAIAKILDDIGFHAEQRPEENFIRETISFSEIDQGEFSSLINTRIEGSIQLVKYRLRQPESTPGPR